ncbi:MAG: hypothetical protein HY657_06135 [Acidobacteria bacterium]|nr:hypothetical protein [Acidobacteriota bacterium]
MLHHMVTGGGMHMHTRRGLRLLAFAVVAVAISTPALAQVDLSGTWATRNHEDWMERWPGPDAGDFTGLPITDDARTRALGYSPSMLALPERQCLYYGATYTVIGPFGIRMWSESDPVTGRIVSWNMSGAVDKTPRTIWMDGRPHPPEHVARTFSGFSTGQWRGNTLVVTTTHMKASPLRRNGVPTSDLATMTEFIVRHGDVLTLTAVIEDPAYLAEPHILSRSYQFDPEVNIQVYPNPCNPGIEAPGLVPGSVPHFLPGENPFVGEMSKRYGLPVEATLGGPDTIYPEFRKKLEQRYSRPERCGRYCCGWQGANTGNALGGGDAPNLSCVAREPPR